MIPFLIVLVILLVAVVELVRRRRLREEYSWLWIGACLLGIGVACIGPLRTFLAGFVPDAVDAQLMLVLASIFLVALCLYFSIQVSSQSNRIKNLAQEVALLRKAVVDLRAEDE